MNATEEQIQAGSRAMCSLNYLRQLQKIEYDKLDVREREHWEDLARVCLTVALARTADVAATAVTPSGSAVAMREALKPFANISLIRDSDPGALNDMIDAPDLAITPKDVRRARAALAAAPQAQEGEREVLIHECAAIADKYDDCGGAFIAQKIRDLLAVSRPLLSPTENKGE